MASDLEHQDPLTLRAGSSRGAIQVSEEFQAQHALGWAHYLIFNENRFNEIPEPRFSIPRVELKSARAVSRSIKGPTTIIYLMLQVISDFALAVDQISYPRLVNSFPVVNAVPLAEVHTSLR